MTTKSTSAAILTIYNAPGMTKQRRWQVVGWLRRAARAVHYNVHMERHTRFRQTRTLLTLKDYDNYSSKGRRDIAAWLRRHAKFLEQHGNQYSKRFTGRYLYA